MEESRLILTKQDEICAMRFLVELLYEEQVISEEEKNKILTEYA